jgi:hypothetical protein
MAGAPVDFGGRVFPNPDNIQPVLDTDIKPEAVEPVGATMSTENYHAPIITREPSKDYERIEPAALGHPEIAPKPKRVLDKTIPFDPIGDIMRHYKIPMTRENYIALNHLGDKADATPEEDAETPTRFQPAYPTHDELAREKGKKTESKKK